MAAGKEWKKYRVQKAAIEQLKLEAEKLKGNQKVRQRAEIRWYNQDKKSH